jgi:prolipoprotein diacylglyceryltransferase
MNMNWYRHAVFVFGAVFVAIGVALLVVTAARGGGVLGFVMGGLFVALGIARIQLERKRARG